ncbi:unnamed protein product, partial [Didymodactylos carnosus]
DLKTGVNKINRMFNQNPLTADNMRKLEQDRGYFEKLLIKAIHVLLNQQSIEPLAAMVEKEQESKMNFLNVVRNEEASRQRIKDLTQAIQDVRNEKQIELQRRAEVIAYQKDQLQEAKAKAQLEITYEKKKCENHLEQIKEKCFIAETDMRHEQDILENRYEDEMKCNGETENFLRSYIKETSQKTEEWLEKYNQETATLQTELDKLKNARAIDLTTYQKIAADFTEYEQVVRDDRAAKERRRRIAERELQQMNAATKIQSWWRGINSYYLLNIDDNLNDTQSSSVICDNLLTEQQTYRIPRQCLTHFYCDSSKCDDQQFRCVKLRESLCCLYKYFTKNCRLNTIKENFRYIYFQLSIQHGYCEINLERIENTDETYCIAEDDFRQLQTTTPFYRHYDYLKPHTKHTYQQHPRVLKTAKHYRRKQHTAARYNHSNNDYYPRKTAFHNLSVSVTIRKASLFAVSNVSITRSLATKSKHKVLTVLYEGGEAGKRNKNILGCVENALGLREWIKENNLENQLELIVTSDKEGDKSVVEQHLPTASVVISQPFWPCYLDEKRIQKAKNLKLAITAGVGSDHVNLEAACKAGITVAEVSGSNVVSVAEHIVMQILALVRNYIPAYKQVINGEWDIAAIVDRAYDLENKHVGTVAAGRIGFRVLQRLKPFDVHLHYYDKFRLPEKVEKELNVTYHPSVESMVKVCDVVTINCPLHPETEHLFDEKMLKLMKKGSYLVNTARGKIMKADALVDAIKSNHLAGYAGDVWYPQPAAKNHPWRSMPNHALTPHYSGTTLDAQKRYAAGARELLGNWLNGKPQREEYLIVDKGEVVSRAYTSGDATKGNSDTKA